MNRTLAILTALAVFGCGGSSEPEHHSTSGAERVEESGSMGVLEEGQEAPEFPHRRIGGEGAGAHAHDSGLMLQRAAEAPPADTREMYRRLAPATVIVRSPESMGTGVVIGPNGLILTNNHVIRGAQLRNFRPRVTVEYGRVGDSGSMVPDGNQRTAWVLKADPNRDLAVLRVEEPVEEAPIVALAAEDPTPGEGVTCLGHGNVGMVWAIRRCEVEATGRLEETYSRLAAICGNEESLAQLMCQQMRERMHDQMHGLMVQSSCPLAPGDSGGPLVDGQGNLVALNVMTIRNEQNQHSNFHVHAREIRDFLREVPEEAPAQVPTPWMDDVRERHAIDVDLDGRWDTIVLVGADRSMTRLHDLDQDSADFALGELEQVVAGRRFDPEVAVVSRDHTNYLWYDTNADGQLDLLLSLARGNEIEAAHRVDAEGNITETSEGRDQPAISPERVPAAARARYSAVFDETHHFSDDPSPLPGLLRAASPMDSNRDGVFDTLRGDRVFVHMLAFDVDQNSLAGVAPDGIDELVRSNRFDAEVSLIRRGPLLWAYYDRDGDGRLETGLRTGPLSAIVTNVVPGDGAPSGEDLVGTLIIRPDLIGEQGSTFEQMMQEHVPSSWIASDATLAGLPEPMDQHEHPSVQASYSEHGFENHVVALESHGFATTAIDVDRSSFRGRNRRHLANGIEQAVREDHFRPDFALSSMPGAAWAWYDTNLDGTWDVVLVRVQGDEGITRNAFRRGDDGRLARDAALVEGRLIRPSLFGRRQQRPFRQVATDLFTPQEIEE